MDSLDARTAVMRRPLFWKLAALAISVVTASGCGGHHGRAAFVGDNAAKVGYDLWVDPQAKLVYFQEEPVGPNVVNGFDGGIQQIHCRLSPYVFRRHAPRNANVGAGDPEKRIGVTWGQVYDALRQAESVSRPRWVRTRCVVLKG